MDAFWNCRSLNTVYCYAINSSSLGQYAFDGIASKAILHVVKGTSTSYQKADGWKDCFIECNEVGGSDAPHTEYYNLNGVRVNADALVLGSKGGDVFIGW